MRANGVDGKTRVENYFQIFALLGKDGQIYHKAETIELYEDDNGCPLDRRRECQRREPLLCGDHLLSWLVSVRRGLVQPLVANWHLKQCEKLSSAW